VKTYADCGCPRKSRKEILLPILKPLLLETKRYLAVLLVCVTKMLDLKPGTIKKDIERMMKKHIILQGR
jgi:hypothetical protein